MHEQHLSKWMKDKKVEAAKPAGSLGCPNKKELTEDSVNHFVRLMNL